MPGYVIADVAVTDAESYAEYRALIPATTRDSAQRYGIEPRRRRCLGQLASPPQSGVSPPLSNASRVPSR